MYEKEIQCVKDNKKSIYAEWLAVSTAYMLAKRINRLNDHIMIFDAAMLSPEYFM
jgi:hypothetical protein